MPKPRWQQNRTPKKNLLAQNPYKYRQQNRKREASGVVGFAHTFFFGLSFRVGSFEQQWKAAVLF